MAALAAAVLLVLPTLANAEGDSETVKAVNARLARLGYAVDGDSGQWGEASDRAAFRLFTRLGRYVDHPSPAETAAALANIDLLGGEIPCPAHEVWSRRMAGGSDAVRRVRVTFRGDRPDEYLAAFYLRLAECHPAALLPKQRAAGALAVGETSSSMPANRTRRATDSFNAAARRLAAYLVGGQSDSYAEPGLVPHLVPTTLRRELARGAPLVDKATGDRYFGPASPPDADDFSRLCSTLGLAAGCAGEDNLKILRNPISDEPVAYTAELSHFEIALELELPSSIADLVLIDGTDAVRSDYPTLEREGAAPFVRFLDSSAAPLSNPIKAVCVDEAETTDLKCQEMQAIPKQEKEQIDKEMSRLKSQYERIKTAIGWTPMSETESAAKQTLNQGRSAKAIVVDPGFDHLVDADTAECSKDRKNRIDCLIDALGSGREGRYLKAEVGKSDLVGHGLHVGHIIAGRGIAEPDAKQRDWSGFLGEQKDIAVTFQKFIDDNTLAGEISTWDGNVVVNRSYEHKKTGSPSCDGEAAGASNVAESPRLPDKASAHAAIETDLLPITAQSGARPHFSVVAAPCRKLAGDGPPRLFCEGPDSDLACLGVLPLALAVAPVRLGVKGSAVEVAGADEKSCRDYADKNRASTNSIKDWVIMASPDRCQDPQRPQFNQYAFKRSGVAWVAAPGEDIFSADGRRALGKNRKIDFGYRERSGSSMATAIVTALVTRCASLFPDLSWRHLRLWIMATSSPQYVRSDASNFADWESNKTLETQIIGIVNFSRALSGSPNYVNVFSDCSKTPACVKPYPAVYYHNSIRQSLFGANQMEKPFAVMRSAEDIYVLRLRPGNCNDMRDIPGEYSLIPCDIIVKEKITEPNECGLRADETKPPCFRVGADPNLSGALAGTAAVDFSAVTHLIALQAPTAITLECGTTSAGAPSPQWWSGTKCKIEVAQWAKW